MSLLKYLNVTRYKSENNFVGLSKLLCKKFEHDESDAAKVLTF